MSIPFSSADLALARRIEEAEAASVAAIVRELSAISPEMRAEAEPFLGGYALFAGAGSPATHAMGIGMRGHVAAEELDRMEAFFRERGSPVLIDLCPMAHPSLLALIFARGYRVIEFNNIMVRLIGTGETFPDAPAGIEVSIAADTAIWSRLVARGFQERDDPDESMISMLEGTAAAVGCYMAHLNGEAVGGGAMGMRDGVAAFFGDSTVVRARGRGVQQALIQARLRDAAAAGCDVAAASVLPGSGSHRNYERAGFRLFYMRVNLAYSGC